MTTEECYMLMQTDNAHHDRIKLTEAERDAFRVIVQPYSGSAAAGCTDCDAPQHGRKTFCDFHRCRGVKANGERCRQAAGWGNDYCRNHRCWHVPSLGVWCTAPSVAHQHCQEHQADWARIWGHLEEPA